MKKNKDVNISCEHVCLNFIEYKIGDKKFLEKESIINLAKHIYGENNAIVVSGNNFFTKGSHKRYEWISKEVLPKVYSSKREFPDKNKAIYFTYVKFAKCNDKTIVGIQSGKSQFYNGYNSDIAFWNVAPESEKEKPLKTFMRNNKLEWYKEEILIIKTKDYYSELNTEEAKRKCEEEAYYNEKNISWGLFD